MSELEQERLTPEYAAASVRPKSRVKLVVIIVALLVLIPPIVYVGAIVFFAQPVKVEGTAMSPTINHGDHIFIWTMASSSPVIGLQTNR